MRLLDLRIELARLQSRCRERSAVDRPGFVARFFARDIGVEPPALRSAERLERALVKRGVKCDARLVQLFGDDDVELLRGAQRFDLAAA